MDSTLDLNPFSDDKHEIIEDFLPNMEEDGDTAVYNSYIEAAENSISTKTIFGEAHFTILGESDIKQLQEADINQVSTVLLISKFVACLLLHHYEWSVNKVIEAWIDNEERVRNAVGLLKQPQVNFSSSEIFMCGICFETLCGDKIRSAECGHPFCMICWMRYVDTKIDEGPYKCLTLRCPEPFCGAAVDGDMVHKLASESSIKRPSTDFNFIIEAWKEVIECRGVLKWCYTYGYYLPDDIKVKKDFFEYIQHKAEVTFEKLDQCVGMELEGHLNVKRKDDLNDFRLKVVQLTNVTKNYFDKLVKALEDGLADVHVNNNMRVKRKSTEIGETSNQRGTKRIMTIDGLTDDDLWQCEACGHYNSAASPVCQDTNCRQYSD
ncbi:Zinc finger, RING-type [Sesbania bispinosa]|nr:Zinc finger, RING-type [Sesbania bispinosa]